MSPPYPPFKEVKSVVAITEEGIWSEISHRINQLKVAKLRIMELVRDRDLVKLTNEKLN